MITQSTQVHELYEFEISNFLKWPKSLVMNHELLDIAELCELQQDNSVLHYQDIVVHFSPILYLS